MEIPSKFAVPHQGRIPVVLVAQLSSIELGYGQVSIWLMGLLL
tara:strand:- start:3077 stop:3205 length:129 start_codon:yes stop_codon:yes gene_type:complete